MGGWKTVHALLETDDRAKAIWRAWTMGELLPAGISLENIENFINGEKPDIPPPKRDWEIDPYLPWAKQI